MPLGEYLVRIMFMPVEAYLKRLRKPLAITIPIFIAFLAVGAMLPRALQEAFMETLGRQFAPVVNLPPLLVMVTIFLNNVLKCFIAMLLGIFFGIAPVVFVAINGLIIGLVTSMFTQAQGPLATAAAVLPHGVIEVPAFILSSAMGVRLGIRFYERIRGEHGLGTEIIAAILFFLVYLLPAFLVAAFIEAYITPIIMSLVVKP